MSKDAKSLNDIRTDVARAAIMAPSNSTWKHVNGGVYRVVDLVVCEADLTVMIVYKGEDGIAWARPVDNFRARFVRL